MLDQKLIRTNPEGVADALKKKGFDLDLDLLSQLDEERKTIQVATEQLQAERNSRSKSIGHREQPRHPCPRERPDESPISLPDPNRAADPYSAGPGA